MRSLIITIILLASLCPRIEVGNTYGISADSGHIVVTMPAEDYSELYNISKEPLR